MLGSYDVQGTARHRLRWKWLKQPQLFWQWKLSNMTPVHNSISTMQAGLFGLPSLATCMFIHVITQFLEKKITSNHIQPHPTSSPRARFQKRRHQPATEIFGKSLHKVGCISRRLELFSVIHGYGRFGRLSSGSSGRVASGAQEFWVFAGDDMPQCAKH